MSDDEEGGATTNAAEEAVAAAAPPPKAEEAGGPSAPPVAAPAPPPDRDGSAAKQIEGGGAGGGCGGGCGVGNDGGNGGGGAGGRKKKSAWQRKKEHKRRKYARRDAAADGDDDAERRPRFASRRNNALELKAKSGTFMRANYRKDDGGWDPDNARPANEGSYADPEMRRLFGVTLPEDEDDEEEDKSGEAAKEGEEPKDTAKDETDGTAEKAEGAKPTGPKRKVALLLAFLGTNYAGMQINARTKSIQAEVELALYRASLLSKPNFGYPHKYGWSNSARTDKGVHSCAQVCSVKIEMPSADSTMDEVRELINAHLPEDIRVVDVVRVTKSFCARTQRDRVRYRYMLPSYALRDKSDIKAAFERAGCGDSAGRQPSDPLTTEEMDRVRSGLDVTGYRVPKERLSALRDALSKYEGTHSYHNYTSRKSPNDPACSRYIETFRADDPVIDHNGVEWIPTSVLGQSFLLHQIRKMISMAVDVSSGSVSGEDMERSFSREVIRNIHVAPASGLFLEMSYFGGYNSRQGRTEAQVPPLDWASDKVQYTEAVSRWKEFKETVVEGHVMEEEDGAGNFLKYLYAVEHYFDPEGGGWTGARGRGEGKSKEGDINGNEDGDGDDNSDTDGGGGGDDVKGDKDGGDDNKGDKDGGINNGGGG